MVAQVILALILLACPAQAIPSLESMNSGFHYKEFTATGVFYPPQARLYNVLCIGGGGGGSNTEGGNSGNVEYKQLFLSTATDVRIGLGGAYNLQGSSTLVGNIFSAGMGQKGGGTAGQPCVSGNNWGCGNILDVESAERFPAITTSKGLASLQNYFMFPHGLHGIAGVNGGGGGGGLQLFGHSAHGGNGGTTSGSILATSGAYGGGAGGSAGNDGQLGGDGYCIFWW